MSSYSDNYETLCRLMVEGDTPLTKYQSKRTGMKICICEVKGPLVHGYLTFATEAHDDDGLPHTLEHLTFMGSEMYPYKGVLDMLANRCLASGTNASTSVDHTCYKMTTVGTEGFLNLLPIFLDHVLYPTLTDEAFLTEVHHVNGEGEDAGVVYCEMQACENDGDNLCYLEMARAMYPGYCGYKSETGGLMKNLRESTTNQKIRDYHRKFYRPDNLCVIITGQIDANDVFQAIAVVEERIVQKGPLPEFTRPWKSPVPPLTQAVEKIVPYPCDDDDHGIVAVSWRGPHVNEIIECTALTLLLQYLSDTSVSPLKRDFVETEEPYCSDVDASIIEHGETILSIDFESVLKDNLFDVKYRLLDMLHNLTTGKEEFDMKRMSNIIHNKKLNILNELEDSPHGTLSSLIITDFLYGETVSDLEARMQQVKTINMLANKDEDFWRKLLQKYFMNENTVVIIGQPSPALKEKMIEEEEARVAKQRETLGEEGLKHKKVQLEEAKKKNEVKVPNDLLQSVPIPSVNTIKLHPIIRSCNYAKNANWNSSLQEVPCCFQLDNLNTKFVTMFVIMDTSALSLKLRMYLPIYLQLIMELPITRNGELISYKDVVTELDADTLDKSTCFGLTSSCPYTCDMFPQLIALKLKVEEEKYEKGVQWLHDLLYKTKFTSPRIQVLVSKLLKKFAKYKRDGVWMLLCLMDNLLFCKESNSWSSSLLRQCTFVQKIQKLLETNEKEVINNLEELRSKLTAPENIVIHMASNVEKLGKNPLSVWNKFIESPLHGNLSRHKIRKCEDFLLPLSTAVPQSSIIGLGSVESCYLAVSTKGVNSCKHPDYPALFVLVNYLTQLEGPLWCAIRGPGLSYNFNISIAETDGVISFFLTKCTQLIAAYKEAKNFIDNLLNGKEEWNEALLESSKSCCVFDIIQETQYSVPVVSLISMTFYYTEIEMDFIRTLLNEIFKVTIDDMKRVGVKYLLPLFDPSQSPCGICCNTSKVEEIVTGFKEMSRELSVITDVEKCFLSDVEDCILKMES